MPPLSSNKAREGNGGEGLLTASHWLRRGFAGSRLADRLLDVSTRMVYSGTTRKPVLRAADRYLGIKAGRAPDRFERELLAWSRSVLATYGRNCGDVSYRVLRRQAEIFARTLRSPYNVSEAVSRFRARYGSAPPWMIAVSPGHACGLACRGCYSSSVAGRSKLPYDVLDRVVSDARRLWNVGLVVVSGGEPLDYRSQGKNILDLFDAHPDVMFLMFTNGLGIDREVARRLERAATVTPALSVEGLRAATDSRRGEGVFERVLDAISHLRSEGVPYGVSATVSRSNFEEFMSDDFFDFFAERMAFYFFLFQYMPMGRDSDLGLMPSPAQRMALWRRSWDLISGKKVAVYDFWNHGSLIHGCVAAGRERGYLHVDWDGNVMPCVFAPYSAANVREVFEAGGDLNDVWESPFLAAVRGWQRRYGYDGDGSAGMKNLLAPCPVRDHYLEFRRLVEAHRAEPEDAPARDALSDEEYFRGLVSYGEEFSRLSGPVWESEYIRDGGNSLLRP